MLDYFDKRFSLFAILISSNLARIFLFIESLGYGCTPRISKHNLLSAVSSKAKYPRELSYCAVFNWIVYSENPPKTKQILHKCTMKFKLETIIAIGKVCQMSNARTRRLIQQLWQCMFVKQGDIESYLITHHCNILVIQITMISKAMIHIWIYHKPINRGIQSIAWIMKKCVKWQKSSLLKSFHFSRSIFYPALKVFSDYAFFMRTCTHVKAQIL